MNLIKEDFFLSLTECLYSRARRSENLKQEAAARLRIIGRLFFRFKDIADHFKPKHLFENCNIKTLEKIIIEETVNEAGEVKHAGRVTLGNMVKNAMQAVQEMCCFEDKREEMEDMNWLQKSFRHVWARTIAPSENHLRMKTQELFSHSWKH